MRSTCSIPNSAGRWQTGSRSVVRGRAGIAVDGHGLTASLDKRVLLIEDDCRLAGMLSESLGKAGFHVILAENGTRGLALHAREPVDAVILDLMLPDTDGLEVCRQIRERADTPILMLTARGDAMDRVVGLELGADDYLPKPFEPRELLARLRALLRRRSGGAKRDVLRFGSLEIDRGAR